MYYYIRNWNIIHRSESKKQLLGFLQWCQIYEDNQKGNMIFEDWKIKVYEKSKQWEEDSNKYHLMKENQNLKNENEKLERIAKVEVEQKSKRYGKEETLTDFEKNIYLLNHLKEC